MWTWLWRALWGLAGAQDAQDAQDTNTQDAPAQAPLPPVFLPPGVPVTVTAAVLNPVPVAVPIAVPIAVPAAAPIHAPHQAVLAGAARMADHAAAARAARGAVMRRVVVDGVERWMTAEAAAERARAAAAGEAPPLPPLPVPPPSQPRVGLSAFAARLIAEAALQRGETCPVALLPLAELTDLHVAPCGHVGGVDVATLRTCPLCCAPVAAWTCVNAAALLRPAESAAGAGANPPPTA